MRVTIRFAIFAAILMLAASCTSIPNGGKGMPTPHPVPPNLQNVDHGLTVFILLSVLGVAAAIALFFVLPAAHRLSLTLGLSAASVFAVSMLVKVTLWLVPWIVGGIAVLALLALAYEVYYKLRHGEFDVPGDGEGNI